jgi:hypothetical protein
MAFALWAASGCPIPLSCGIVSYPRESGYALSSRLATDLWVTYFWTDPNPTQREHTQ